MAPERSRRRIPDATVSRLPVYLRILAEQADEGVESISSEGLAELAGVNAAKVRKDLSYLGSYGTRGVGYEVAYLVYQIRRELGLTHDWPAYFAAVDQAECGSRVPAPRGFLVPRVATVPPYASLAADGRVDFRTDWVRHILSQSNSSATSSHPHPRCAEARSFWSSLVANP